MTTPQYATEQLTRYGWRPSILGPYSYAEAHRAMAGLIDLAPERRFRVVLAVGGKSCG
jgi:hypothetical protein